MHVFSYLHVLDAWSLQLVNQRWRSVLASDQFLRAALQRWSSHDPEDAGRALSAASQSSIWEKILHMQSLRLGKPFTKVEFMDTGNGNIGPQPQLSHRRLDLKGDTIAYISSKPGENDVVVVRNLVTGEVETLQDEARVRILSLAVSTELVAFVTFDGYLQVSGLQRGSNETWATRSKLPSAHVKALCVDKDAVAVAIGGGGAQTAHITQIIIYRKVSQQVRDLDVRLACQELEADSEWMNSYGMLIDDSKEIVDLFTLVYDFGVGIIRRTVEIRHMRMSFTGEVLSTSAFKFLHTNATQAYVRNHLTMAPPVPTGYAGRYRIQVGEVRVFVNLPILLKFDAMFDAQQGCLEATTPGLPDRLVSLDPEYHARPPTELTKFRRIHAQWKGLALAVDHEVSSDSTDWMECYTVMNDSFHVDLKVNAGRTQLSKIRVSCFDPKLVLHGGEDLGYWRSAGLTPTVSGLAEAIRKYSMLQDVGRG